MNQVIISAVISLGAIGGAAAIILYFVAQKFKVIEDPRIDEVDEILPAANCGGCGYAGCRAFAEAIVKTGDLDNLYCPVGGNEMMKQIAPIIGVEAKEKEPEVAVVRCNGTRQYAPEKVEYDGPQSCAFAHSLFAGKSGCPNGCLGLDDCVESCDFDAMYMDEETGLPVIIEDNCVACGACVDTCPRDIIELRPKGKKDKRVFISCVNTEKGAVSRKHCSVSCIGCGQCVTACPFDAISMENNLAYIHPEKCKLCRLCVPICPTNAIVEANFPEMSDKLIEKAKENYTKQKEKKKGAGKAGEEKAKAKKATSTDKKTSASSEKKTQDKSISTSDAEKKEPRNDSEQTSKQKDKSSPDNPENK
ncbi:MAG: RnfABCDGE type electron transport complex subunit B [Bacteroidales bacterium]|nr:RnfABCDGE type electron transport complex subunit B [Bacteroidales bacterium]